QTTTRSGLSATMRSRSSPVASPTRGTRFASGGQSAGARTPTICAPAPAAYRSSVACGARLTTRSAGALNTTCAPVASVTATGAARSSFDFERHTLERCIGDVLRCTVERRVALENDQIPHAVAVRHQARGKSAGRIAKRDFGIVRSLRLEIGVGKAREIEVV